jgi:hypothetical protein
MPEIKRIADLTKKEVDTGMYTSAVYFNVCSFAAHLQGLQIVLG